MSKQKHSTDTGIPLVIRSMSRLEDHVLLEITQRITQSGANLVALKASTLMQYNVAIVQVHGTWDSLAKLEPQLDKLKQQLAHATLDWQRVNPSTPTTNLVPYMIDLVCVDKMGVLNHILSFLHQQHIDIAHVDSHRYQSSQTNTWMFQAQITIGIPQTLAISHLREAFMDLCEHLDLDALLDPIRY